MTRKCSITGKSAQCGHNVSHADNKSKRRFGVNLQIASLRSEATGRRIKMRLATSSIRLIDKRGGFDAFLVSSKPRELPSKLRKLRDEVVAARSAPPAAST